MAWREGLNYPSQLIRETEYFAAQEMFFFITNRINGLKTLLNFTGHFVILYLHLLFFVEVVSLRRPRAAFTLGAIANRAKLLYV